MKIHHHINLQLDLYKPNDINQYIFHRSAVLLLFKFVNSLYKGKYKFLFSCTLPLPFGSMVPPYVSNTNVAELIPWQRYIDTRTIAVNNGSKLEFVFVHAIIDALLEYVVARKHFLCSA